MPAPLRVDVFLLAGQFPGTSHAQALHHAMSYALAAERAGFDGVWIAEHHFLSYGTCPSALAFAAHLLGATSRIRVGTAAAILSTRHPVVLAEEAILLDELSGGRLDVGVARGGPWLDLQVFGTGLPRYQRGFAEALDLMLRWLSGTDTVSAGGEFFQFPPVPVVPRPGRPVPVWVAATSPPTARLATARGLPLLLGMHATARENRLLLDEAGADPHLSHATTHLAHVADTEADAHRVLRAAMPAWLATTAGHQRIDNTPGPRRDPHAYLDHLLRTHPVGPPELCVRRLTDSIAVTGTRRLLLMAEGAGHPDRTPTNLARLGAEVLAPLRQWHARHPLPELDNGTHFR